MVIEVQTMHQPGVPTPNDVPEIVPAPFPNVPKPERRHEPATKPGREDPAPEPARPHEEPTKTPEKVDA